MNDVEAMRRDIVSMVVELRASMQELGDEQPVQANVVSNARDRLRYISALTEQSASRTLDAAEAIRDRLHGQRARATELIGKTRSPEIRAFLRDLAEAHDTSCGQAGEIIEAQVFQDLVGQVINKLLVTVQKLEDNLVHLLVEDEAPPPTLSGPVVKPEQAVSQDEIDDLFG
jgi:chemotaxis protein CheZ